MYTALDGTPPCPIVLQLGMSIPSVARKHVMHFLACSLEFNQFIPLAHHTGTPHRHSRTLSHTPSHTLTATSTCVCALPLTHSLAPTNANSCTRPLAPRTPRAQVALGSSGFTAVRRTSRLADSTTLGGITAQPVLVAGTNGATLLFTPSAGAGNPTQPYQFGSMCGAAMIYGRSGNTTFVAVDNVGSLGALFDACRNNTVFGLYNLYPRAMPSPSTPCLASTTSTHV